MMPLFYFKSVKLLKMFIKVAIQFIIRYIPENNSSYDTQSW